MASTSSPFTCQGEPVDVRTWASAYNLVEERVKNIERNFARVAEGKDFDDAFPRDKLDIARRILNRNMNGIGRTTISFSEGEEPIEISQEIAKGYFDTVLAPVESLHSYLFSRTSRREIGSVEGRIVEIGTDFNAPALHLEEHNTGRSIWCRVSPETAEQLGTEIKAGDAWAHRRVRVRGIISYDEQGNIIRVRDGNVAFIESATVDLDKIEDKEFTGGYTVNEYLDRLRENEFG